jgi:hypothetical protein
MAVNGMNFQNRKIRHRFKQKDRDKRSVRPHKRISGRTGSIHSRRLKGMLNEKKKRYSLCGVLETIHKLHGLLSMGKSTGQTDPDNIELVTGIPVTGPSVGRRERVENRDSLHSEFDLGEIIKILLDKTTH